MAKAIKKNRVANYFHGLSTEWKQIHWPKQGLLAKQSVIVLAGTLLIAGICIAADTGAIEILKTIG